MLDLPFPRKKPRIMIDNSPQSIKSNSTYLLSNVKSTEWIGLSVDCIGSKLKIGDMLLYDGGIGAFKVDRIIDSNTISIVSCGDFDIYDRKSLGSYSTLINEMISSDYIELIASAIPDYVALSFVESKEEAEIYNSFFPNARVISKIETEKAIKNIDQITTVSNVMVARGDLRQYSNPLDLYFTQKAISESSHKNAKQLFFATDVLESLRKSEIPSSSDLIDMSVILSMRPDGIILNSPLVSSKAKEVIQMINSGVEAMSMRFG